MLYLLTEILNKKKKEIYCCLLENCYHDYFTK